MIDEGFYAFISGSMGDVYYYKRVDIDVDPKDEQDTVDQMSRESLSAFQPPPGLFPAEYTQMFQEQFAKSRTNARDQFAKTKIVRFRVHTQLGNEECVRELEELEVDPDFQGWENRHFVQEIMKMKMR